MKTANQELIDNYSKLEKALDKACERLSLESSMRTDFHVAMSKNKWKEWALNETKEKKDIEKLKKEFDKYIQEASK